LPAGFLPVQYLKKESKAKPVALRDRFAENKLEDQEIKVSDS